MNSDTNKYELKLTKQFKKHLKLIAKRNIANVKKIHEVVDVLQKGEKLPERFCDHELKGDYKGNRECHVLPDLLLIYKICENVLILTLVDTGTHSDLFGK